MEILHSIYILNSKYSSYRVLIFFSVPLEHVIHTHTPSVCSVEILGKCFVHHNHTMSCKQWLL